MNLALDHWHIEPSGTCTLKCPRCTRAELPHYSINKNLSLEFFQKQLGYDVISKIKKITFCGNNGDPIYCKDLLDILQWIKSINPAIEFVIITNGSYKPVEWWEELSGIMTENDEIHWSIDGWDQQSNEQYRVNSDWVSIMTGIREFRKHNKVTYTTWATIAFVFNENHIADILQLANQFEFDLFQLTLSTKFGSKYPDSYGEYDVLEPLDKSLIPEGHRFDRRLSVISGKKRPGDDLKKKFSNRASLLYNSNEYPALCYIGNKGVFLNSLGEFYPCCWVANDYDHNKLWSSFGKENFNLHKNTFTDIMSNNFWDNEFKLFNGIECASKCTKPKLLDKHHTTEW